MGHPNHCRATGAAPGGAQRTRARRAVRGPRDRRLQPLPGPATCGEMKHRSSACTLSASAVLNERTVGIAELGYQVSGSDLSEL